jgi:thiamine monophosphate kinase
MGALNPLLKRLQTTIDIAHNRIGRADISREYYSDQNPHFILHEGMDFELVYTEESKNVRSFLRDRADRNAELPNLVHAIW